MAKATHDERFRSFAAELARLPDVYMRLLATHVGSATGACLGCTMRGSQRRWPWPCGLYALARMAQDIAAEPIHRRIRPTLEIVREPEVGRPS